MSYEISYQSTELGQVAFRRIEDDEEVTAYVTKFKQTAYEGNTEIALYVKKFKQRLGYNVSSRRTSTATYLIEDCDTVVIKHVVEHHKGCAYVHTIKLPADCEEVKFLFGDINE